MICKKLKLPLITGADGNFWLLGGRASVLRQQIPSRPEKFPTGPVISEIFVLADLCQIQLINRGTIFMCKVIKIMKS